MSGKKGRKCSMINCDSFQHTHKHLSFFRFPKDPVRCNMWIKSSGRPELADKTAVYEDRICQLHFDDAMFLNDYRNRLHTSAVPNPQILPSAAMASPTEQTSGSEPPTKRAKNNLGLVGLSHVLNALSTVNKPIVAPSQQPPLACGTSATMPSHNNTTTMQQAYVIAAHAVQSNAMSLLSAAEKFGVDFVTLRRFCRRIEKTMGNNIGASKTEHAQQQQDVADVERAKVHKKQQQLALLEAHILAQQNLLQQQQFLENSQQNQQLPAAAPAARKDRKRSVSAAARPEATTGMQHTKRARQIFSLQQEEELAHFVRETSDYYNGMSSKDVRTLAFVYAMCNRVEVPAGWQESAQASFDWCLGFIKRNKLSPMMTTSNMYKMPQDKSTSLNGKVFGDNNHDAETAEC